MVKKRTGAHEDTIREFRIGRSGLRFGAPLAEFQGIMRGVPSFVAASPLPDASDGE